MGDRNEDVAVRCACGAQFTLEQWGKLELAGVQDDEDAVMLEMRNCPCGSTRARTVDFRAAVRLLNDETKRLRRALARLRDIDRAVAGLPQEIADIDRGSVQRARSAMSSAIDAGLRAVDLERERCAKLAISSSQSVPFAWSTSSDVGIWIAEQIRKVP
jgi:hypothetical protein